MKVVDVKVRGIRPLFFHAFKVEVISNLNKVKSGSAGNDPDEWKRTVLERNGTLYIPGAYWSGCLKGGARYTKAGRGTLQKSFTSGMLVLTDVAELDRKLPDGWEDMSFDQMPSDSSQPVYLDVRGVMNPNSKGRNVRYRVACSPGWRTSFQFEFDENVVSPAQVKKIVEDSGKMVGVGDGLVLGYGRFAIEEMAINDSY